MGLLAFKNRGFDVKQVRDFGSPLNSVPPRTIFDNKNKFYLKAPKHPVPGYRRSVRRFPWPTGRSPEKKRPRSPVRVSRTAHYSEGWHPRYGCYDCQRNHPPKGFLFRASGSLAEDQVIPTCRGWTLTFQDGKTLKATSKSFSR